MRDWERYVYFSVMGVMVVMLIVALIYGFKFETDTKPRMQGACEQRGGVLLQRTYQTGKYSNSLYTCIKKEVVIDYEP